MEKVRVSKEVAEAIEQYRASGMTNRGIIDSAESAYPRGKETVLKQLVEGTSDGYDLLLKALVIGYEVEQTPEDKVREMFQQAVEKEEVLRINGLTGGYWEGRRMTIIDVLNALGHKIEGVNA